MFLITNISSSEISISDLGITIYPKQVIDLHKIETKILPDRSKDLTLAINKKCIKIIEKDVTEPIVIKEVKNDNKELFEGLKDIISSEIQKQLGGKVQNNNSDLNNIISQLSNIIQKTKPEENIYSEIDEDKLTEIHKKASIKMSQNTENSVEYIEEKIINKSVNDISELENLL